MQVKIFDGLYLPGNYYGLSGQLTILVLTANQFAVRDWNSTLTS